MWTPKRIVLLVLGFVLFATGYFAYSFALGGIDGLPPLPEAYLVPLKGDVTEPLPPLKTTKVEEKLRQAFGLECPESKRPIKLELSRNNMVLAADEYKLIDGRLMLKPFSVALFGKPKDDGKDIEINTIRSNVAYLTFDRPITSVNPNELNGRKITAAELRGDIEVINNRRTPQRDDDLELFIKIGPLYYQESNHLIWTFDDVHVTDRSSKPNPHKVDGKGMELELATEAPPPGPGHKSHQDAITGVKRITLQSDVDMHLYIGSNSGFLGKPNDKPNGQKAKTAVTDEKDTPAPSHLHITTPGRFQYFFYKDFDTAHFEVTPGNQAAVGGPKPLDVVVIRDNEVINDKGEKVHKTDQLLCERLDLKLTRKDAKSPPDKNGKPAAAEKHGGNSGTTEQSVNIESADAYGKHVTLTSDMENFSAEKVVELHHDAKAGTTVLKGNPLLQAEKEGSTMLTRELRIKEIPIPGTDRSYQEATAYGPGQIDMLDKKTNKKLQHAYWNDTLLSTKDEHARTAKGEMQDLLVLTGKARFVQDEGGQEIQAETLKVWLSPEDKTVEKATPAPALSTDPTGAGQGRVQHLQAIKNVMAKSNELNIHDTGLLNVYFKDAPPTMLPAVDDREAKKTGVLTSESKTVPAPSAPAPGEGLRRLPDGPPAKPGTAPAAAEPSPGKSTTIGVGPQPHPGAGPAQPAKKEEPRPIDLSARSVEAYVLRSEVKAGEPKKDTLDHLFTEGNVHVRQAPAKEGDQGVDIRGETLSMFAYPEGNLLTVTGSESDLAKLLMDKILIVGPEVNIDQVKNKVWVTGAGAMRIDSATTLSNKPLEKSEPVTVMWQKSMFVQGKDAEFNIGIVATQNEGRMMCNVLRVTFDKPISLKEGPREDKESPKVQTMQCDGDHKEVLACVEDKTMEGDKLMKYQRLVAQYLQVETMDPEEIGSHKAEQHTTEAHQMHASGPGFVKTWQLNGEDPLAPSSKDNPNPPATPKPPSTPGNTQASVQTAAKPPAPTPSANPQATTKPATAKPAAKSDDKQPKMTLVTFGASMYANSKTNFASFRKNVRVLNMPVENAYIDVFDGNQFIDVMLASLPEGAMYLSCQNLEVWTRQEKGKNYQEMDARDDAVVQGKDFWGRAAHIHFDEAKDQVIFEGGPSGIATLYKCAQQGDQPQTLKGKKILYNRVTGETHVIEGGGIEAN